MSDYDHGNEILSTGVVILLFLFFPIGIIVLIARTINRLRNDKIERDYTRAQTVNLKTDTSINQAEELARYKQLYDLGVITAVEFEAKKQSVLTGTSLKKELVRRRQ